jgi:beta-mannosidase
VSDAVIDWYYCKKLAFQFIKRSQQQLCLMFDEPQDGNIRLYAVQDGGKVRSLQYKVRDMITDRTVCEGFATVAPDCSTPIETVSATDDLGFWLIEWTDADCNSGRNHYTTKTLDISYADYLQALQKSDMDEFEGF